MSDENNWTSQGDEVMQKTILVTGATDGIGLETVKMLVADGHNVLLHGRNREKLANVARELSILPGGGKVESYIADFSRMTDVEKLSEAIIIKHEKLDVLINNAGVFVVSESNTIDGLDVRFAVNTIAPYLLTKKLLPLMGTSTRVVNLSSAAQAPVNLKALKGSLGQLSAGDAYAQSKLALTMWSFDMANSLRNDGPSIIAVNPKSFLGSKMVRQAYGATGGDLRIGADILCRAAFSDEFSGASGKYFDNDIGTFAHPHPDALNRRKCKELVTVIEEILAKAIN